MEILPGNKVQVSRVEIALFNARWPCSELRSTRSYWFQFDAEGDLMDCDVPASDDGAAASALADDARDFLIDGKRPDWSVE
jgi:hypothetical protein